VLRKVFRRKFVIALKLNFRRGKIAFHGTLKPLAHPKKPSPLGCEPYTDTTGTSTPNAPSETRSRQCAI
jgi:hypothetical protein